MFSLPDFSRKLIEEHIDQLFDLMAYWTLGTIPHGEKAKTIVFGTQPPDVTLANLFVQSLRNNKPNANEEDALKGMLRNSNNYINGIRERTKARSIAELESYIHEKRKNNEQIDYKEASQVLRDEMDKSKKEMLDVVSSESQRVRGIGTALDIKKVAATQGVDDPVIFWVIMRDQFVCKFCLANHLLEDGITPRVFKMSEVSSGYLTQQDRKDGKVSVSGQHPHCFHPETRIHSSLGLITIKEMFDSQSDFDVVVDKRVRNRRKGGNQFGDFLPGVVYLDRHSSGTKILKSSKVYETGEQECLKITLDSGQELTVTEDHEMWVDDDRNGKKIKAKDLLLGQKIPLISGEGLFGDDSFPYIAELIGNLLGDGCFTSTSEWRFFGNDIPYGEDLRAKARVFAPEIQETGTVFPPNDKYSVCHTKFASKVLYRVLTESFCVSKKPRRVPKRIWGATKETVSSFLRGLYAADGHSETKSVVLGQNDREFLIEIQVLLSNFGIISRIFKHDEEQEKTITYANGDCFLTKRKACWRLVAGGVKNSEIFSKEIGFGVPEKQRLLDERIKESKEKQIDGFDPWRIGKIEKIEKAGKTMTYCLTEPMTNTVTANGIVTGQCRCSFTLLAPGWGFQNGKISFVKIGHDEWKRQRGEE